MQKITFHNNINGLEVSFATDTPQALLAAFDGNSLAAEFTQYKPIWFEGIRTKTHTFNARTITFTVNWYAVERGKYSREKALAEWDKILYVFAPGNEGTLTWTNGTKTRTIDCYANETPMLREKARSLFSADFALTADFPFWRGTTEHSQVLTYSGQGGAPSFYNVENNCPIPVYPLIKAECTVGTNGGYTIAWNAPEETLEFDKKMQTRTLTIMHKANINDAPVYIDNQKRRVYQYLYGSAVNKTSYLSPLSSFFNLLPGDNNIVLAGGNLNSSLVVTFSWFDHYLGVYV